MKTKTNPSEEPVEVLIAEDSPTQAEQLRYLLEQHHFRVTVAENGKQALALLGEHTPTVVITDIVMPEMNGFELCQRIKADEHAQDIPVILLTSLANAEDVLEGLASGADSFITKPYSEDYLLTNLQQILANRQLNKSGRVRIGVEILFAGKKRFITADQQQMLTLLISTYEAAVHRNAELIQAQDELSALNAHLEDMVDERTAALVAEIAERKRVEADLERTNRSLVMISECNQALVRIPNEMELLRELCRLIIQFGGYRLAWVGYTEDDEKKTIRPVAWTGDDDYIARVDVTWADVERGQEPVGKSIREQRPVFVQNIETDDSFLPWRAAALERGYGSAISLPLIRDGRAFGALSIYAPIVDAFNPNEIRLLSELAGDMAYGITTLRTRAEHEQAVHQIEVLAKFPSENPHPMMRVTPDGNLLYANRSSAPVLAAWKWEVGQPVSDDWRGYIATAFHTGENAQIETSCGDRIYSFVLAPVAEAGYVNVYGRDVTESIRAEKNLQESEERYRALVESAPDAIVVYRDGHILYANSVAVDLCGLESFEQLRGKTILSVIDPDERAGVAERIRQGMEGEYLPLRETKLLRPDGTEVPIETVGRMVDYQGEPAVQVFVRDITQRKRAEEQLRKLSMAVTQSPTAVVITDLKGDIEYVNPRFTETTGYALEEVRRQNPRVLKSGETSQVEYEHLWKTITSGGEWRGEFHNKKKDGSLFWERAFISPIRDAAGTITHFLGIKEDITQQKRLEEQYRQAQKMEAVGQLAGGVAHDFNNILQAIVGYSSMLLDRLPEHDETHEFAEEIAQGADRAAALTRQLLAFSRRQVLEMEDLDLNDVVNGITKMIRRLIGENVEVEVMEGRRLGIVHADPGQMEQVLLNLCINARDAMPEGGILTIETENVVLDREYCDAHSWATPGRYVLLSVTDTGCGMDAETQTRIFEPFFTTKELGKGTGLGLATVYGVVKQHQGMIQVYSEVGKGTRFKVYLPSVEGATSTLKVTVVERARGGTETILVADDDETMRKFVAYILESAGYTVLLAVNGEEATETFAKHAPNIDLCLLDVVMPKMSGKAVYDVLRQRHPQLRFLFTSGYSANAIHTDFVLESGIELIQKPYAPDALLRRVRKVLDDVGPISESELPRQ